MVKGYEPMEAIKGKDYGKERQRYPGNASCNHPHSRLLNMASIILAKTGSGFLHCRYSDYTRTESGLQFQDLRPGTGKAAKSGSQVTVDWDGYTIGLPSWLVSNSWWTCVMSACWMFCTSCSPIQH